MSVEKSHISLHVFHLEPERRQDLVDMMRDVAQSMGVEAPSLRLKGVRSFPGSRYGQFRVVMKVEL